MVSVTELVQGNYHPFSELFLRPQLINLLSRHFLMNKSKWMSPCWMIQAQLFAIKMHLSYLKSLVKIECLNGSCSSFAVKDFFLTNQKWRMSLHSLMLYWTRYGDRLSGGFQKDSYEPHHCLSFCLMICDCKSNPFLFVVFVSFIRAFVQTKTFTLQLPDNHLFLKLLERYWFYLINWGYSVSCYCTFLCCTVRWSEYFAHNSYYETFNQLWNRCNLVYKKISLNYQWCGWIII